MWHIKLKEKNGFYGDDNDDGDDDDDEDDDNHDHGDNVTMMMMHE